jgi:PAS domain S-box-containing protein
LVYRAPGLPERTYYYAILPVSSGGSGGEYVILLMEDITERIRLAEEVRQAERHLVCVIESANDLVISTDPQGRILSWNNAAVGATGFGPSEVKQHLFTDILGPSHHAKWSTVLLDLADREEAVQAEWSLRTKQGTDVPVSWVCSRLRDYGGALQGVVAVGRDLTERKKLQLQILRAQKLAALAIMAGGIAHEIRNPLSVASLACEFLQSDELVGAFAKECAQKIQGGVHRASAIIEKLLRFARPAASNQDLGPVDLRQVAREAAGVATSQALLHHVVVNLGLPETPVMVMGCSTILEQVVLNLLLNAIKAMPSGGEIVIEMASERDQAVLRVRDQGVGIPEGELDQVFDPFYTTGGPGEGMGLGLSFCYAAIKDHFGSIEVDSRPGVGTTVAIRLPAS